MLKKNSILQSAAVHGKDIGSGSQSPVLDYHAKLELPVSREFLLSCEAKNGKSGRKFLQRLFMRQDAAEYRLAGSFTYDDTFL